MNIRQPIPEEFHEEMGRVIRAARRQMLVEQPRAPRRRQTWRDVDRVCLPGWLLSRPFQAIANLLHRPGPEIGRLLERLGDRIDGIDEPRRPVRLLRSAVHWLLSAPNDAPPAIPEETWPSPSSDASDHPAPGSGTGSSGRGGPS